MNFNKIIYILILVIWFPLISFSEEKIVSVATLDDYSPYCFPAKNKKACPKDIIPPGSGSAVLQGYSWDILRASFHEMGYTIELHVSPWARAMNDVKSGRVDLLFPAGKNSERERIFTYSKEPVNKVNFLIYIRKDAGLNYAGISSLNNLTIGAMRGWNYGEKLDANTQIKIQPINKI
ncbi:MAG: transporter substrate-binding domain-containing protein, partial [Proteobacteria bacterium]|nr:transporter substrate-binding domain-containing protein [Pseudomonadota bacterium]